MSVDAARRRSATSRVSTARTSCSESVFLGTSDFSFGRTRAGIGTAVALSSAAAKERSAATREAFRAFIATRSSCAICALKRSSSVVIPVSKFDFV